MEQIFGKVSFMSISAMWLILAVLALRLLLKNAPKRITCILWCVVAFRLVVPVSIESAWSLAPDMSSFAPGGMIWTDPDEAAADLMGTDNTSGVQSNSTDIVSPKAGGAGAAQSRLTGFSYTGVAMLSCIWTAGVLLMLLYLVVSYLRLKRRVKTAVLLEKNVWQSEHVDSPFVFGVVRPRIYIPYHLNEETYEYVWLHEEAHLSRKDHWLKAIVFLILSVHWFNPLVWLSYALLCKDIELACDECVTRNMSEDEKKKYALALLNCSGKQSIFTACPISFGEVGVKERVVRVKKYMKPSVWITGLLVVICLAVVICFVTAPRKEAEQDKVTEQQATDEAIVNTDIREVLSYELPEGLTECPYSAYTGFMGGCTFEPDVYKVEGSNSTPPEWKSAGMISRYNAEYMLEWDGDIITGIHGFYNHTMIEPLGSLDDLCVPAFLVKGSHDLYTASEYYELQEMADEVETTSDYWYVFFARPQDKIGYVVSLNAKNYTQEDMIEFAKTIQYLQ